MNRQELEEYIARWLCEEDNQNPDDYYEEFNRDAAAAVDCCGDYEGWYDDVFPKIYLWTRYQGQAYKLLDFCKDHGIDVLQYVLNKPEQEDY